MVPPQHIAALIFSLLVCGDAKVETRVASGFNRKDRKLEGASSIWNGSLTSSALCLSACMKLNCLSLTFGRRECTLYATYLCHPEDRFHLSLVTAPGVTYFDLYSNLQNTLIISKKDACVMYGRCLEKCEEGSWTTTTTTTTAPESPEKGEGSQGSFSNSATLEHGSSQNPTDSKLRATTSTAAKVVTPPIEQQNSGKKSVLTDNETHNKRDPASPGLGSSVTHDDGNGTRTDRTSDSSAAAAADDTATVTSLPGPTLPPEKLGSGILLIQTPMTFDDAHQFCVKSNMSLAMPQSKREHTILVKAMKSRNIARMWIGVRKITEGGIDATYIDGRVVSRQLLLWGEGQPNNSRGGQICVEMNASLKYLWNDFDCLYKTAFVCR